MSRAITPKAPSDQHDLLAQYEDAVLKGQDPTGPSAQAQFRRQLQRALPALASDVTKFLQARPVSVATPGGSIVQMVDDAFAMTKDQVKLATTIIAKMLPNFVPENFNGTPVEQMPGVVKVTINQVGPDVDLNKMPGTPVSAGHAVARKTSLVTISKAGVTIGGQVVAQERTIGEPDVHVVDAAAAAVVLDERDIPGDAPAAAEIIAPPPDAPLLKPAPLAALTIPVRHALSDWAAPSSKDVTK